MIRSAASLSAFSSAMGTSGRLAATIALSRFEPITAPEPLCPATWPLSPAIAANRTICSPAGPTPKTLIALLLAQLLGDASCIS